MIEKKIKDTRTTFSSFSSSRKISLSCFMLSECCSFRQFSPIISKSYCIRQFLSTVLQFCPWPLQFTLSWLSPSWSSECENCFSCFLPGPVPRWYCLRGIGRFSCFYWIGFWVKLNPRGRYPFSGYEGFLLEWFPILRTAWSGQLSRDIAQRLCQAFWKSCLHLPKKWWNFMCYRVSIRTYLMAVLKAVIRTQYNVTECGCS